MQHYKIKHFIKTEKHLYWQSHPRESLVPFLHGVNIAGKGTLERCQILVFHMGKCFIKVNYCKRPHLHLSLHVSEVQNVTCLAGTAMVNANFSLNMRVK